MREPPAETERKDDGDDALGCLLLFGFIFLGVGIGMIWGRAYAFLAVGVAMLLLAVWALASTGRKTSG